MTTLKKSELQVLEYAKLTSIPDEISPDERKLWPFAVVKVLKVDGSHNYAYARHDGLKPEIIRDFGNSAQIARIESIHPTALIPKKETPKFLNDSQISQYLAQNGFNSEKVKYCLINDRKEVERMINLSIIRHFISVSGNKFKTLKTTKTK